MHSFQLAHACHMPCPSYSPRFITLIICGEENIQASDPKKVVKLLIYQTTLQQLITYQIHHTFHISSPGCSRFLGDAALSVSLLSRGMPPAVSSSHDDVLDPDSSSSVTVGFLSSPKWFYRLYTSKKSITITP
jgi:hypothetical protein